MNSHEIDAWLKHSSEVLESNELVDGQPGPDAAASSRLAKLITRYTTAIGRGVERVVAQRPTKPVMIAGYNSAQKPTIAYARQVAIKRYLEERRLWEEYLDKVPAGDVSTTDHVPRRDPQDPVAQNWHVTLSDRTFPTGPVYYHMISLEGEDGQGWAVKMQAVVSSIDR